MARINTYSLDTTPELSDKFIGTDATTGGTKNYTVSNFVELINDNSLIDQFDGIIYTHKDREADGLNPKGILNLNVTGAPATAFSAINEIALSHLHAGGDDVQGYIDALQDNYIKVSKQGDLNSYGIYQINNIAPLEDDFKLLTVRFIQGNGTLQGNERYFISNWQSVIDRDFSDDSVTEFSDVSHAGSGRIITDAERNNYNEIHANGLRHADVIDNLTDTSNTVPLSANQGRILNGYINTINTLLSSDETTLDTLQEVVDFIQANRETLNTLGISSISGLQAALNGKVDKITGKGLSTEDLTTPLRNKLIDIEAGAQVNVNADWSESNPNDDAYIENKPTDVTDLTQHNATSLADIYDSGSGRIITQAERNKLSTDVVTTSRTITVNGTNSKISVEPAGAQSFANDLSFVISLPDNVNITSSLSVGEDLTVTDDVTVGGSLTVDEKIVLNEVQTTEPSEDNVIYITNENDHDTINFKYHGHKLSIDTLTENLTSGILAGGELSISSDNTEFTIQAGRGIIVDLHKTSTTEPHPEVTYVDWTTQSIGITGLDSSNTDQLNTWIYINSDGSVGQQTTPFTDAQYRNKITIGSVIHSSGEGRFAKTFPVTAYSSSTQFNEFIRFFGPLKRSGHVISANGANLSLDRSAGKAFALGRNYSINANAPSDISDPSKTLAKIHRYYQDGSGGFVKDDGIDGNGYTTIDPSKFDNGTGTLANMPNNKFSIQRVYYFPSTPDILIVYYGRGYYDNKDVGERSIFLEEFKEADNTSEQAIHVATILVRKGCTSLQEEDDAHIYQAGLFRNLSATFSGGVDASAGLNDLADVRVTSPTNGQALVYNAEDEIWENGAGGGGGGGDIAVWGLVGLEDIYYSLNVTE